MTSTPADPPPGTEESVQAASGAMAILFDPVISSELLFSMFGFWTWAIVTSGHAGRLVRTGGIEEVKDEERGDEFLEIFALALLTIGLYTIVIKGWHLGLPMLPSLFAIGLPVYLLGRPPR